MSDSTSSSTTRPPGALWLLAIFAGFAVLALILQGYFGGQHSWDTRHDFRTGERAKLEAVHAENLGKMGLKKGESADSLNRGVQIVTGMKPSKSAMAVPGSPTQLRQAEEAAAAATKAAAPAGGAAPAPAPGGAAAPAPAPAPAPAK